MSADTTTSPRRRSAVSGAAPPRQTNKPKAKEGKGAFNAVSTVLLCLFAAAWLIPSLFALKTSLTANDKAALGAEAILKDHSPTLDSYTTLLKAGDIWNWYLASAVTSVVTVVLTVLFASMAAYALSRLRFRGRNVVFLLIILGIMVPGQVLVLPIFQELNAVHLLNTYWAVIFPQVPAVIAIFVFKQFFDGLPRDLDEAARVDGAGSFRVYWTIIMPLARPVVSAVAIFTFVWSWNNLLWPLLVLTNPQLMTVPVGLATVQGNFGIRYADTMATALLGAAPLIAVFLLFQRNIVEGIAGTGLKG
jgi:multiple sugar transport system permease protein